MARMKDHDTLQRFLFDGTDIRGEITTLTSSYRNILALNNYPAPIALLFGEFLVAASLIGASLKHAGIVTVQATGSGPVTAIMAECTQNQGVRGIVRGNFEVLDCSKLGDTPNITELLGSATLAITIEPETGERYQGIVEMVSSKLSDCLEHYFQQSAQLKTKIKLAVSTKSASGLLIQQMPLTQSTEQADLNWQHLSTLMDTLKDSEQLKLSHNDQLYRLFHEDNIRTFESQHISFFCSCSLERTERALVSLGSDELLETCKEQGLVIITCQFCDQEYRFDKNSIQAMFSPPDDILH